MAARSSLSRRILWGLLGYAAVLTLAVFVHGVIVNERAEALVEAFAAIEAARGDTALRGSGNGNRHRGARALLKGGACLRSLSS